MTLYTQASKNVTRTWLLMSVFVGIVVALGWFFSYYYDNPGILYIFALFAVVMNVVSYWYSDKIVLSLAGAKEANREEYFDLYTIVENLSITAGLPKPKIYIVTDPAPNAFATGRDKNHAVIAVTTGILSILNKTELEGVIAHELSHVGNKDMLVSTVAAVLVGFVSILADVFLRTHLWSGRSRNDREGSGVLMLLGFAFVLLSPIFATLIQLAISRKREYLADASGALLTRYPEGLASALEKIGASAQPMQRQSSAIAHLYIADPRGKVSTIQRLFMSHPPIEDRIKALTGK